MLLLLKKNKIMKITNVVCSFNTGCRLDLVLLNNMSEKSKYNPLKFSGLVWKEINITCLIFQSGHITCLGNKSIEEAHSNIDKCLNRLKQLGFIHVTKSDFKVITMSAVYKIKEGINLTKLVKQKGATLEPELFPAAFLRKKSIHYTCYHTGVIVITGIKSEMDLINKVSPTLIEIELM